MQSRDGYIWFTTPRGMVRFDGVRFEVFDSSNTPAMRGTNFVAFSLFEDSRGIIWAGTWNAGVIRYENGVFGAITTQQGLPNNSVLRVDEDEHGTIWLYTDTGLSRIRNGKLETLDTLEGEPFEKYQSAAANLGADANLWGFWRVGRKGLERFAYGKWCRIPLPKYCDVGKVKLDWIVEDSRRQLHFAVLDEPGRSFQVANGELTVFSGLPKGSFVSYQDAFGRLWITDVFGRIAIWKNRKATPIKDVSASALFRVVQDNTGSFWVGSLSGGLAHQSEKAITSLTLPGGPGTNVVGPIVQDRTGNIWAGSYGLTRLSRDGLRRFVLSRPSVGWRTAEEVFSLWADSDGTLLYGYTDGLKLFKNGRFLEPEEPLHSIRAQITAILRDRTGTLWLGSSAGLYSFNKRQGLRFLDHWKEPVKGQVRALYEDQNGTLWVGTDECLCRYRDTRFSCFEPHGPLDQWRIRSIISDADGIVWVGTANRGLLRLEKDKLVWIGQAEGLPSNDGAGLVEDRHGYFWIGSHLGIYRVKRDLLNALAHGRVDRVEATVFRKRDGLLSLNCVGNGQPHSLMDKDGTIWFPTANGLAHIDPEKVQFNNVPPKVQIGSCLLDQRVTPCNRNLKVSPDVRNLEIRYTALSLVRSDQTTFKYRLQGSDPKWIYAGDRTVAYYSHLDPGTYRFLVTAANGDGVWNQTPKELLITVLPHFYQLLAFRFFAFGTGAGSLLLIWRTRSVQLHRRQARQRAFSQQIIASQEAERKRIAGELHDSLGQRLSLISNMALLATQSTDSNQFRQLRDIATETSLAANDVRQISRNLRPFHLDILGLSSAMEMLAKRTCESARIQCSIQIDDLTDAIPKTVEIHLYRVLQECLNNIVKHAGASEVSVTVRRTPEETSLVVTDNGVGFSPERSKGDVHSGGFGLIGIVERSELLGGKVSVRSAPREGTTITLQIQKKTGL